VRFRNFFDRFQIVSAILQRKKLPGAVRPHGLNRSKSCHKFGAPFRAKAEARWHAVLKHFQDHVTSIGRDPIRFVFVKVAHACGYGHDGRRR
jgi:hypothetical protein